MRTCLGYCKQISCPLLRCAAGGNVELVEIDGPTVVLKLKGACGSCPSSMTTMTMGIKRRLQEKIPYVLMLPGSGRQPSAAWSLCHTKHCMAPTVMVVPVHVHACSQPCAACPHPERQQGNLQLACHRNDALACACLALTVFLIIWSLYTY